MADVVNLRQARKRKARDDKERIAEANRLAFGRTKAEKQGAMLEKTRVESVLDAHKRDSNDN